MEPDGRRSDSRTERLDKVLLARHPDFSRSRIEGLVKAGFVSVNGAVASKAGMKVSDGDDIVDGDYREV